MASHLKSSKAKRKATVQNKESPVQTKKGGAATAPLSDTEFAQLIAVMPLRAGDAAEGPGSRPSGRVRDDMHPLNIAVAVSGGADSMALLYLLARWARAQKQTIKIHAVTVDHGLRPESKREAQQVAAWVKNWPGVTHHILTWCGVKPKTKISETARAKRYELLQKFCTQHAIKYLFVAHHLDDQAETILMRLAAGSGVDGLAGMRPVEVRGDDIVILRPLLAVPHERLCATLRAAGQEWADDPTNINQNYVRPRLRAAAGVLAAEGLTPMRLAVLSARMNRARAALAAMAENYWAQAKVGRDSVMMPCDVWGAMPDEMQVRTLIRALAQVAPRAHTARLEQIEALCTRLMTHPPAQNFRATLAGCIITRGAKWIKIARENR